MKPAKKKSSKKPAPAGAKKVTDQEVCYAADRGSVASLTSLLKAGGNPNACFKDGKYTRSSALYLINGTPKVRIAKAKALLAAGADVNYHRAFVHSAIDRFLRSDGLGELFAPLSNSQTRAKFERILRIGDPNRKVEHMVWLARMFLGPKKFAQLEAEIQEAAEGVAANKPGALGRYKKIIK